MGVCLVNRLLIKRKSDFSVFEEAFLNHVTVKDSFKMSIQDDKSAGEEINSVVRAVFICKVGEVSESLFEEVIKAVVVAAYLSIQNDVDVDRGI